MLPSVNETHLRLANDLLRVAGIFARHHDKSEQWVARQGTANALLLEGILDKTGCTLKVYGDMMQFLSDNWPDSAGQPWPSDIARPVPLRGPNVKPLPRKRKSSQQGQAYGKRSDGNVDAGQGSADGSSDTAE